MIELSMSNETDCEYSLMKNGTTSTTFSMDESSCSSSSSTEMSMQMEDTENADEDTDSIHEEDTDSKSIANDVKGYRKYEQRKPCVSESAAERLYVKAVERNKRLELLGDSLSDLIKTRDCNANVRIICENGLEAKRSANSTFDVHSVTSYAEGGRKPKTVRWSNVIHMRDIEFNVSRSNSKIGPGKQSVSEIAGCRLHSEAMERKKRLELLRIAYHKHQPVLILLTSSSPSLIQSKDIKFSVDTNNSLGKGNMSISEIAGCRLHEKAREREKRLASIRKECHEYQPKLILETRSMKDIKVNVDTNNNPGQGDSSTSEIAGYRLYLEAIKRNKRLALLRKECHEYQPKLILETGSMKDIKVNLDSTNNTGQGDSSISEIAGCRLYLEAIKRNKRLALLKKMYQKYEPRTKLILETKQGSRGTATNCVEQFQRLYALSKPMQESGKQRRKDIERARVKKEVFIHPTEKISTADSTRLYYLGMKQIAALEQRRIVASESGEYKSPITQPLLSF